MHGRHHDKPYTESGVKRLPCARCGEKSHFQWQICSDNNTWRPLCKKCDVALNQMVLRWIGFKDWRKKISAYKARHK